MFKFKETLKFELYKRVYMVPKNEDRWKRDTL